MPHLPKPAAPKRILPALVLLLTGGCHRSPAPAAPAGPHESAIAANQLFLSQKTFDPWVLTYHGITNAEDIPFYKSNGYSGTVYSDTLLGVYLAGRYSDNSRIEMIRSDDKPNTAPQNAPHTATLNLHDGTFSPDMVSGAGKGASPSVTYAPNWPQIWRTSDVVITGDPQAQQVTHANLFYLLSSTYPGSDHSIPPMGLSSTVYGGHIFWDAEVWMLPALLPQHPDYAKAIIDYRFKRLAQARRNAQAHGYQGAEFPWESAETGAEVAPAEFARERHITADVAWAAWQYYLWTGDMAFLRTEGWPLLRANADYWVSRVTKTEDGQYHINKVLSPDETAGVVDDDAWTNAVVHYTLSAATRAATLVHQPINPQWGAVAPHLARFYDKALGIPQENSKPLTPRFAAKQADTLLLLHPLGVPTDAKTQGRMLDYYAAHTIANGPAMTASIHAIVAARLGRAQQSLDEFHNSYRPFERGPWDAFSEKRTTNNVYFLTGMAGCVQAVLYGFAGLQVVEPGQKGQGTRIAGDSVASLYADPHLPPGWSRLTVQGVRFRGRTLDVTVLPGNTVKVIDAITDARVTDANTRGTGR